LSLVPDRLDATAFDLSIARGNGTAVRVEMAAVGGSLAGMARFADDDIAASRARLGQIMAGVAQAFNDQQAGGLDSTGAPGSPFFTVGTPTASAAAGNGGSAQLSVSIANGSAIKASDYALAWDGSNYQLTRLADGNVSSFAALPQSVDGLTISLGSGTPAQGDRFLLRTASTLIPGLAAATSDPAKIATASASTTADWASDNRNAKALLALGDALAVVLMEHRQFTPEQFRVFHPGGKLGARLAKVRDLMHSDMPLVRSGTPMAGALLAMSGKGFGVVGVTDADDYLVGVVTDGDLRRHMDGLLSLTADQVMTKSPRTIGTDALAEKAVAVMNEKKITCLFVVDPEGSRAAVGILHIHDCLRAGVA
jgi:CBS domain-containing protein